MRVVFLSDDFPPASFGGAGISTFELALAVHKLGHDVSVITTCRTPDEAGKSLYEGLRVFRIYSNYHERWRAWRGLYNRPVLQEVRKLLDEIKPDAVHANNVHYHLSWAALKVAKQSGAHVVWTARDSMAYAYGKAQPGRVSWLANLRAAGKRYNPLRNVVIRHYLSYVDHRCAVSRALARALAQNGIPHAEAIHTGLDATQWQVSDAAAAAFVHKHKLAGKQVILIGGRLAGGKGRAQAEAAFAIVRAQIPNAVLLAMGSADVAGAQSTGWIDGEEKRAAYAAADLVWVPSMYLDPLPRVALEAMAAGKPVVATCFGGAPEAVVDGMTGFVLSPHDIEEWSVRTLELLQDQSKARAFGDEGRERITRYFNLASCARGYERLYIQKDDIQVESYEPGPGSMHDALEMLKELTSIPVGGTPASKLAVYKGFELWWLHYNSLFNYFCLPFTQYQEFLTKLKHARSVTLTNPPFERLFVHYLRAHGVRVSVLKRLRSPVPLGVVIQMTIMLVSLPVLMVRRPKLMLFVGDKLAAGHDYDPRMASIYAGLRERGVPMCEFVRSIEPWHIVLRHAVRRRRAVVHTEAVSALARFLAALSPKPRFEFSDDPECYFKQLVATEYLRRHAADIWAVRIMYAILWLIGVRAAFVMTAAERNFPTVLALKLRGIPTVGLLHGVASPPSTPDDFMPGFSGRSMSVDRYGLWSEWWKSYYEQYSDVYGAKRLVVSGPIRPVPTVLGPALAGKIKVLFVAEQAAAPQEVLPYLRMLINDPELEITIKFRSHRDGFEEWLRAYEPALLKQLSAARGSVAEALAHADVAVGCHSTAVLEAVLQGRMPVFIKTRKWGDYYRMEEFDMRLLAHTPQELAEKVRAARTYPKESIAQLRERYFGDPGKDGSAWVVQELLRLL